MPKAILYFSAVMSLLYMYFGLYIAFSNSAAQAIKYPYNVFLGILLFGYGAFRVYRFYQILVKKND
ncbi:MAG: hypothetical protein H7329_10475 [Opitutaceae bacterium]|nr:hypothetical protein [Cytophagales bacterium]